MKNEKPKIRVSEMTAAEQEILEAVKSKFAELANAVREFAHEGVKHPRPKHAR